MIPLCLVLGDSTAVGTADALARQGIRCEVHARVNARSGTIAKEWRGAAAASEALIALGSNDADDPALERSLMAVRGRTPALRITWLAPYHGRAALIVRSVAARFGDRVLPLTLQPTRDGIHPAAYGPIATSLGWSAFAGSGRRVNFPNPPAPEPQAQIKPVKRAVVLLMSEAPSQ
jgi:hypothetical protein